MGHAEQEADERRASAMTTMKGGDHYTRMGMQPFTFTLANGWDGAAHSILKYIARHKMKGGKLDLEKARHIVEIRVENFGPHWRGRGVIEIDSV